MRILVLDGPNLNRLGTREPEMYGSASVSEMQEELQNAFPKVDFQFAQSNVEGVLIDKLQEADADGLDGVVLNPGGYTHTSVALRDAVASIGIPVVEVHLSNLSARETFRHESLIAPVCIGHVAGFGVHSYLLGVYALAIHQS